MIYSKTLFSAVRSSILAIISLIASADILVAQINVTPVRLLLTSRQRDVEVEVSNPLDVAVEVTSKFNFKPLRSDSLGTRRLDTTVSPADMAYSCEKWLRLFPQRFTLPPRGIRSIRIVVVPPDTISDGEYWARLELTSEQVGLPRPAPADTQGLVLDLRMKMQMGIPITFRKGKVETGIEIGAVQARRIDSGVVLLVDTKRLGNAAYRGTMKAIVRGTDGGSLFESEEEFTNERELRNALKLPALPPGDYDLLLESHSERKGSIQEAVLEVPPVKLSYDLLVSGSDITIVRKE